MSVSYDYDPFGDFFVMLPNSPTSECSFLPPPVGQLDPWCLFGDVHIDQLPPPETSPITSNSAIKQYPAPSYPCNAASTCSSPPQKRSPYWCHRCNRTFSTTTNFTRHDATSICATSARGDSISYPCKECNKSYNRKDNLKKHIKDKHPVAEADQSGSAPR